MTKFSRLPYTCLRPLLFQMKPEFTHRIGMRALASFGQNVLPAILTCGRISDPLQLAGLVFPNRVGLAAGLDKNGSAIDGLARLGFGFIEVGTVTPIAQQGNPKPRLFRLSTAGAIVNRMGFNSPGLKKFCENVRSNRFQESGGILGLNIGKNATTSIEQASSDYLFGLAAVYPLADYVSINISSPNTRNLRSLQHEKALDTLLLNLRRKQQGLTEKHRKYVPLFLKIAPDLDETEIAQIAQSINQNHIDGVIACNTSVDKSAVAHLPHGQEQGGLSGKPILQVSNRVIRTLRRYLGPNFPIIGVGGIFSTQDAASKIEAGADLVQIYTGLIYQGPALVREVAQGLKDLHQLGNGKAL